MTTARPPDPTTVVSLRSNLVQSSRIVCLSLTCSVKTVQYLTPWLAERGRGVGEGPLCLSRRALSSPVTLTGYDCPVDIGPTFEAGCSSHVAHLVCWSLLYSENTIAGVACHLKFDALVYTAFHLEETGKIPKYRCGTWNRSERLHCHVFSTLSFGLQTLRAGLRKVVSTKPRVVLRPFYHMSVDITAHSGYMQSISRRWASLSDLCHLSR